MERCIGVCLATAAMGVPPDGIAQIPAARERLEVTGTHIPRSDYQASSPIQVITREQIERSGATDVASLLREVPAMSGPSVQDFDAGTGFQRGSQSASLHGMGPIATLVLVNGRRLAPAPFADPNTSQGSSYNLNSIPLAAVERIEVLKDGASPIYGADAIAGVVNIILRSTHEGGQVSWSHWQSPHDFDAMNYRVEQVSAIAGFGDLARDRHSVLLAAQWDKRYPQSVFESGSGVRNDDYRTATGRLTASGAGANQSFPANLRRQTSPGVFGAAGRLPSDDRCQVRSAVECLWNNYEALDIVSERERASLHAHASMARAGLTLFGEASFSRAEASFPDNPPGLSAAAPPFWFNRAGDRLTYQLVLPAGHPDNPLVASPVGLLYRFADFGDVGYKVRTDWARALAGASGEARGWSWETALQYVSAKRLETTDMFLSLPALRAAIADGAYRFSGNAPNARTVLESLHPTLDNHGNSRLYSWDVKAAGELGRWFAGTALVALGAEVRREDMKIESDPRIVAGEIIPLPSSTVDGNRTVAAAFAELTLVPARDVEAQLAARFDHYSDFGSATTPKVGLKWAADESWVLRGTYSRGFRAPSLFQSTTSDVQAFLTGQQDPLRCPGGVAAAGASPDDCNRSVASLVRANHDIKPERSTSYTFGFVAALARELSVSASRWYVHQSDFINRLDPRIVLLNENNPSFTQGSVTRNPNPATWLPGIPNSGPLQYITRSFGNFGDLAASGIDVDVAGRWKLERYGKIALDGYATYNDKLVWRVDRTSPYLSALGNLLLWEAPRFRTQITGRWDYGPLSWLVRYSYVSSYFYGQPAEATGGPIGTMQCFPTLAQNLVIMGGCHVGSFETFDAGLSWTGIKGLTAGVLVRNVLDKAAPYDPDHVVLGFNPALHNPYGRYLQLYASFRFR
jgi:iron complex outermembrane receptor protein